MKFILGTKLGMSQIFDKDGNVIPVTLIEAWPNIVLQLRTKEKNGYNAVQIGTGSKKRLNKPMEGYLKDLGKLRYLREFRVEDPGFYKRGDQIRADIFQEGDEVKIAGVSKGKGFAGVVKRHGFKGLPHTHGQKHEERKGGSIGRSFPEHVTPGTKMAGRMGGERVTVRNVKIAKVDPEKNLIAVRGAVPGRRGTLLEIRS